MGESNLNEKKRDQLRKAASALKEAASIIDDVKEQECDALDSMPENLQASYRYDSMEAAVDEMEEAIDYIEDAVECVETAIAS